MKHPILSVVIPTYNCSKLLSSLLCKLRLLIGLSDEVEVIVIDDGSTEDMSWLDCMNWARVFHLTKNYGVSHARNFGVEKARGDYVTFVDSDDEVLDNFVTTILWSIESTPVDILDFKVLCEDGSNMFHWGCTWGKAFNRKFISNTQFNEEMITGEDEDWYRRLLRLDPAIVQVAETIYFYHWSANPDSLCKRRNRGEFNKEKTCTKR